MTVTITIVIGVNTISVYSLEKVKDTTRGAESLCVPLPSSPCPGPVLYSPTAPVPREQWDSRGPGRGGGKKVSGGNSVF